jgi:hypothetical protein
MYPISLAARRTAACSEAECIAQTSCARVVGVADGAVVVASGAAADVSGEDDGGEVAGLVVAVSGVQAVFCEFV